MPIPCARIAPRQLESQRHCACVRYPSCQCLSLFRQSEKEWQSKPQKNQGERSGVEAWHDRAEKNTAMAQTAGYRFRFRHSTMDLQKSAAIDQEELQYQYP